jgi:YVTN family beta-propeller protein
VVINTATNTITATVSVGGGEQFGIQVSPDGSKLYLASYDCSCVSVMNTANNTLIATIPIGNVTSGIALSLDGSKLYVRYGNNQVAVVSTATNTVTTSISLDCSPSNCTTTGFVGLAITPDGSKLYVEGSSGSVTVVSTSTNQQIDNITGVAGQPSSLGIFIALPTNVPPPPSVPPSGTACNGVYNGTFNGDLTISAGQDCRFINGGQITGSVVQSGGNFVLSGSAVGGGVSISGGTYTIGPASTIGGDLQVQSIPIGNANNFVCGSQINGNLTYNSNGTAVQIGSSSPMSCAGNTITGNLTVNSNGGSTLIFYNSVAKNLAANANKGMLDVVGNNVGGNLTCQNDTNLVMGGGNTAKRKVGQCN